MVWVKVFHLWEQKMETNGYVTGSLFTKPVKKLECMIKVRPPCIVITTYTLNFIDAFKRTIDHLLILKQKNLTKLDT